MKLIIRGVGIGALVVAAFIALAYITMFLWNWLMPYLFHLPTVDLFQSVGLVVLSKILFGGIHLREYGIWGERRMWKAKWKSMTIEDRNKFKEEFAARYKQKWRKTESDSKK